MKSCDERFVLYARGHRPPDVYPRHYVPVFYTAHEAKSWLDKFIADKPFTRTDNTIIVADFTVRSNQLDQILSAPPANAELRTDFAQWILRFKYGTWDEVHEQPEAIEDGKLLSTGKPKSEPRPDKPIGMITIAELCKGTDLLPTHARAALRAAGMIKSPYGWAFPADKIAEIKKTIGLR